ncbi:MAG: hypothetical protein RIR70_314 [Pseudomonadota bacterium]
MILGDIQLARVGEIEIPWVRRGVGSNRPKLLFISGTGGDLRHPPSQFDRLLDAHFDVLRFDQRGMGQASKPDVPYTMADYAADAAGLMAALEFAPAVVLGYSFGGMVAQELALRFPDSVSRLGLLCTTAGGQGGASWPLHTIAQWPIEARAAQMIKLSDLRRDDAWQAAHPALYRALLDEQIATMALVQRSPEADIGRLRQLEARRHHDTFDRLTTLAMPVAVFGGQHDGIACPDAVARLAAQIKGALLAFFEGGHLVHVQNRSAAREIVAWLAGAL